MEKKIKSKGKLFYFANYELIDCILKIVAIGSKESESEIVEKALIEKYVPKNKIASWILQENLLNGNGSIKGTLEVLFDLAASGLNVPDLLPFVNFARNMELDGRAVVEGDEGELHRLASLVDTVIDILEESMHNNDNAPYNFDEIAVGRQIAMELREEPSYCIIFNMYAIVLKNWECLSGLSVTYRLLHGLVRIANNWREYASKKSDLLKLMLSESKNWLDNAFEA